MRGKEGRREGGNRQKGYREDERRMGIKEKRAERKRLTNYRMVMENSDPR